MGSFKRLSALENKSMEILLNHCKVRFPSILLTVRRLYFFTLRFWIFGMCCVFFLMVLMAALHQRYMMVAQTFLAGFVQLSLHDQVKLLESSWLEVLMIGLVWRSIHYPGKLIFAPDLILDRYQQEFSASVHVPYAHFMFHLSCFSFLFHSPSHVSKRVRHQHCRFLISHLASHCAVSDTPFVK